MTVNFCAIARRGSNPNMGYPFTVAVSTLARVALTRALCGGGAGTSQAPGGMQGLSVLRRTWNSRNSAPYAWASDAADSTMCRANGEKVTAQRMRSTARFVVFAVNGTRCGLST